MDRRTEAHRLQALLSAETGVPVELNWTDPGAGKYRWHVEWCDGPTKDAMRAHVDRLTPRYATLKPAELRYSRIVQPLSAALFMVRNVRLGLPPLGDMDSVWDLEWHFIDTNYPERGTEEDLLRAKELVKQSNGLADQMLEILTGEQGVVPAVVQSGDNVIPFKPRR